VTAPARPGTPPTVVIYDPIQELDWSYDIEQAIFDAEGVRLVIPQSQVDAEAALGDADVLIVCEFLPTALIPQLRRCVGLLSYKVGLDTVDGPALAAAGIPIRSVAGYCTEEVSDHALTLMLAAQRRLLPFARSAAEGDWEVYDRPEFRSIRRVRGQTLGILGAGRIGSRVAAKAQAFGMTTIAYDPFLTKASIDGLTLVPFDELLASSDALILCSALTDTSTRILDKGAFEQMRSGVILVNVARGKLIDEDALLDAVLSGQVAVAALDVRAEEPPDPATDELRALPNVILTQHMAATSVESHLDLHTLAAAEVLAMLRDGGRG
jgi:D-3-phosphoglycerate dehydrogenase / 2-oxoglutarate reductase